MVGGSTIELRHFAAGHTDADLAVVVPEARLVVAGDLVLGDGYSPVVHVIHGGSVVGLQCALEGMVSLAGDDWCLVPGHGEIGGPSLIGAQRDYLGALFAGVKAARARGLSLDEAKAALDIEPFRHHLLYDFVHVGHVEAAWRELGETGAEQP